MRILVLVGAVIMQFAKTPVTPDCINVAITEETLWGSMDAVLKGMWLGLGKQDSWSWMETVGKRKGGGT